MKVSELISILEEQEQDADVVVFNVEHGFTSEVVNVYSDLSNAVHLILED